MITLIVGASVLAGIGLGWYGYKASIRIEAWGRGMNECDLIFQAMSEDMDDGGFRGSPRRPVGNVRGAGVFAGPHLGTGAAGSK
jgi:hypothetical protein